MFISIFIVLITSLIRSRVQEFALCQSSHIVYRIVEAIGIAILAVPLRNYKDEIRRGSQSGSPNNINDATTIDSYSSSSGKVKLEEVDSKSKLMESTMMVSMTTILEEREKKNDKSSNSTNNSNSNTNPEDKATISSVELVEDDDSNTSNDTDDTTSERNSTNDENANTNNNMDPIN